MNPMDSLAFLARAPAKVLPLYVVYGDESFLKRQVIHAIKQRALGVEADDSALSTYAGETADFAAIFDELETAPFFTPRRLVIVEEADSFVTANRTLLEKKAPGPWPATSTLVLEVKSWPANTRLAKMVADAPAIACKSPPPYKLPEWCVRWAAEKHGQKLAMQAAQLLVDLVGPEMGLLDQEILKLATYVGDKKKIEIADVDVLVGQSRGENTWKIFEAISQGQAGTALTILDRLFDQGEEPFRMVGAFNMQLRRLAQAARLAVQGMSLTAALEQAGVPPFAIRGAEQQLRHLGRARALRLYDWLLEANLGLRGGALPERTLLERLVVRLASKAS